jgi:hypothetical protein
MRPQETIMRLCAGSTKAALAWLVVLTVIGGPANAVDLNFTQLNLLNGWVAADPDYRKPSVALDSNDVVHLRGAIAQPSGSSAIAFVLPNAFRPNGKVYVPVDILEAKPGRLVILPDGTVSVFTPEIFEFAQAFTSLEGVTFTRR